MFVTNFRIEAPSDHPSLMQSAINAFTLGLDMTATTLNFFAPYQVLAQIYRVNRMLARGWTGEK